MVNVLPEPAPVKADQGRLLWIGGDSYLVTRLPDLPLFKSPVKLEKLTGDRATYYAAQSVAGAVCSCPDHPGCQHVGVLRCLGYLSPARGLREEVASLFFGEVS